MHVNVEKPLIIEAKPCGRDLLFRDLDPMNVPHFGKKQTHCTTTDSGQRGAAPQ